METGRLIPGSLDHSISPRFAELKRMGVVEEIGSRECKITGRVSLIWDVTDGLPVKFEKEKKQKCPFCKGKGHLIEQQTRFNL